MIQDIHIRDDVQRELFYATGASAARIGVSVEQGVVTLTGRVDSHEQKVEAVRAAERVPHVRAVACQLECHVPGPFLLSDSGLAHAVANILAWDSVAPQDRIRVRVENGWVTLEGTVDWQQQKDAATSALSTVTGIRGVDNLLCVNPTLDANAVKEQIEAALKSSPRIEDRDVLVEVKHDQVVLHGEVRSLSEREEAERIAWSAEGVADVANHILVAQAVSRV